MQISPTLARDLTHAEVWVPRLIHVGVIVGGAWALTWIARRLLRQLRGYILRVMDRRGESPAIELEKRAATIVSVLGKLSSIVIWIVAIVMALNELDFKIEPLLAGLGVAGLAVGLGAQALIKDWLGGLLLLLEDQLRIGDAVTINGISGSVEEINIRTTVLRGENGAVHIISNGTISVLTNMTRGYSYYVFETTVAHRVDADRVLQILQNVGAELSADERFRPMILAPMEGIGVSRLSDRGVTIRARIKTLPSKQGDVGFELNRRMNTQLAAANIEFPKLP